MSGLCALCQDNVSWKSSPAGDVPRVDGELAVARELGDKSLKHLSSESEVSVEIIIEDIYYLILASDDIWKDLSNQEAVDCIKHVKCPQTAA
ncbi:hypothetical protein AgCh_019462 [Apium graveolens]